MRLMTLVLLSVISVQTFAGAQIARLWHGRTPTAKADAYEKYLGQAIEKFRKIAGNEGYQMFREDVGNESHFTVISYWNSLFDIHGYAGTDISKVHNLSRDPEFLIEPEKEVRNYRIIKDERTTH